MNTNSDPCYLQSVRVTERYYRPGRRDFRYAIYNQVGIFVLFIVSTPALMSTTTASQAEDGSIYVGSYLLERLAQLGVTVSTMISYYR
jgi:hypothetical protein